MPEIPTEADIRREAEQWLQRIGAASPDRPPVERVYDALVDHWKREKRRPTMRELADAANGTASSVSNHVATLIAQGRVVRVPNDPRGAPVPVVREG